MENITSVNIKFNYTFYQSNIFMGVAFFLNKIFVKL
nr:MAG TPA: hypothetical protein [Caudoviricetes sp.]